MFNEFWFKPKVNGYGATPVTWEGYTLVALFIVVILVCVFDAMRREKELRSSIFPPQMKVGATATLVFLIVCFWKTQGSWG